MTLGTRVAVMRDGVIEQVAPPRDLYRAPANTFVARFVGAPSMNLWPSPEDTGVLIGVRPHDIDLARVGEGDGNGGVGMVEARGPVTLGYLGGDGLTEELVRVVVPAETPIAEDDRTGFRVRRDRIHRFDEGTGRRLG